MEFVSFDPKALVRAANVRATLDAFSLLPTVGERILERHALLARELRPDNFVPVQSWLDVLRDVQTQVGTNVLREVGARIIENADFPPQFGRASTILESLDEIYHLNHRGEVGHYRVERVPSGDFIIRCETPYPRHFEWGLVEGITRNKRVHDHHYVVSFEGGPAESSLTCTLTVQRK